MEQSCVLAVFPAMERRYSTGSERVRVRPAARVLGSLASAITKPCWFQAVRALAKDFSVVWVIFDNLLIEWRARKDVDGDDDSDA
jgi:hypothetical protein